MSTEGATARAARWVAEVTPGDIPQEAYRVARLALMDYVGVTFPGSREPLGKIITEYVRELGGVPETGVMASGLKTSPVLAALANGAIGHALDYDDALLCWGHATTVLGPAVLAMGEKLNVSGRDILFSYIVGTEIGSYVGLATGQRHYDLGWHGTSSNGSLATAAAMARMLRLNEQQVRMALGIAASRSAGLRQNFGSMVKPYHAGMAASSGIEAAVLASKGYSADPNILETGLGFAMVLSGGVEGDWDKVKDQLGKDFTILSRGMLFKPWPSCAGTHGGIDAALFLKKQYQLKSEDIAEIEVGTDSFIPAILIHHRPTEALQGKFSMEYTVARALHSGEVRLKHFTDESVREKPVQDLIQRTKMVEKFPRTPLGDPSGFSPQEVTVRLKDGRVVSRLVSAPRGSPCNPLTQEEMVAKYLDCASGVLTEAEGERSVSLLLRLEELNDIRELMKIVTRT